MIIEGAIAVKSAIGNHKRTVSRVYIDKDKKTKDFNYIRKIVKAGGIELLEMKREELSQYLSGRTNGGIGAEVSSRKDDVFDDGDIFYLEGIEDPFNLGYAMRTLYALGFTNVLLSPRDYSSMDNQLLKSSAGAYDMLNVKVAQDSVEEIGEIKNRGYHIYALYRSDDALDIFDASFVSRSLYMLGGEKRGISSALLELADDRLFISYGSDFRNALNACAALDVVAALVYRQKRK